MEELEELNGNVVQGDNKDGRLEISGTELGGFLRKQTVRGHTTRRVIRVSK